MEAHQGFLIKDVGGDEEFEAAVRYAEALGVLRDRFDDRGWFFVSRMEQMGQYFKQQSARRREMGTRMDATMGR